MSTRAQVLVQLLEKIPNADKLQRLLEPENLLYLLQQYGYQNDDIQQRLNNGTLPGELLLELLEQEPDSEYLLVMLSNTMDTKVEKRVVIDEIIRKKREEDASLNSSAPNPSETTPSPVQSPPPFSMPSALSASTSTSDAVSSPFGDHYVTVAVGIMTFTSIIPALMHTGFLSELNIISSPTIALIIAFIGGAVAGAIVAQGRAHPLWKGILIGIVLNLGVILTTTLYAEARESLFKVDIVITFLLGSIPAILLYLVLIGRKMP